jgi:hypothetical protein
LGKEPPPEEGRHRERGLHLVEILGPRLALRRGQQMQEEERDGAFVRHRSVNMQNGSCVWVLRRNVFLYEKHCADPFWGFGHVVGVNLRGDMSDSDFGQS